MGVGCDGDGVDFGVAAGALGKVTVVVGAEGFCCVTSVLNFDGVGAAPFAVVVTGSGVAGGARLSTAGLPVAVSIIVLLPFFLLSIPSIRAEDAEFAATTLAPRLPPGLKSLRIPPAVPLSYGSSTAPFPCALETGPVPGLSATAVALP
jgi:hypothetical protein